MSLGTPYDGTASLTLLHRIREPLRLVEAGKPPRRALVGTDAALPPGAAQIGLLPPLYPEWLGDRGFCEAYGLRFPYVVGEMANGIATEAMVVAAAQAGTLGFFGSAGLAPARVVDALGRIRAGLKEGRNFGVNLIHSPGEPALEQKLVELYAEHGVTLVSASAFMALTPALVELACRGLVRDASGTIRRRTHIFAKVSRAEVAEPFLSPAPAEMVRALVAAGRLTAEEADLAGRVAVAECLTVEGDSGGHTDNRPLVALFPSLQAMAVRLAERHNLARRVRVGAGGGLGTPAAVAAAFAMGAAYVITGSVNQAAIESGLSPVGRDMLAQASQTDVMPAPAADMFELGAKVQVLKRGTLFGPRAARLVELYAAYPSLEALPADQRDVLEKTYFRQPLEAVWAETQAFFAERDPAQIARAEGDPRHRMALLFRWYLGNASRWAITGEPSRRMDYQIWCGPAMGAFNEWAKGSFLEQPENRTTAQIALNLMEGAAIVTRAQQARALGVAVPDAAFDYRPRRLTP